jgi:GDP-4-dehydro-6-deoxy-D-mannose reductase
MRAFITGVDGFIGSWLGESLVAAGDEVFGLSRSREGTEGGITRLRGDLTSRDRLAEVIAESKPDRIFHLASQNNIKDSFADPALTIATNVVGVIHLLDTVRQIVPSARFVSVGSSAEYGLTASAAAHLTEDLPLQPTSPYGISKVSQGQLARVYASVYGLQSVHVRPFAVIGPRKTRDALSDFCRNVVALERGQTDRFIIGNLEAERDFIDVRDCVAALVLVSERAEPGVTYNICNGGRASLQTLLSLLQPLSLRRFEPVTDPSRLRPADDPRILGDPARLRALGYQPRFALADTVASTLEYWRTAQATP